MTAKTRKPKKKSSIEKWEKWLEEHDRIITSKEMLEIIQALRREITLVRDDMPQWRDPNY